MLKSSNSTTYDEPGHLSLYFFLYLSISRMELVSAGSSSPTLSPSTS